MYSLEILRTTQTKVALLCRGKKQKYYYKPETEGEHLVITYTGLNIRQIDEMDFDEYLFYMREAYIYNLNQTEDGREYLANCWRMTQTKPERAKLREQFGQGVTHGGKH